MYAFGEDSPHHEEYSPWLTRSLGGREDFALFAAAAVANGARVATADRGFSRFPCLQFFDPVS